MSKRSVRSVVKTIQVAFCTTEHDRKIWTARAERFGLTLEQWARLVLRRAAGMPSAVFDAAAREHSLGPPANLTETFLNFRVFPVEKEAFQRQAREEAMSFSQWARQVLRAEAGQESTIKLDWL